MSNQTQPNEQILTDRQLTICEKLLPIHVKNEIVKESLQDLINSHRSLLSANAELSFKNQKLKEKDAKVAEFMEWAKRIIDSGMGAGILRYDPVQFFIEYHTYLKTLEVFE